MSDTAQETARKSRKKNRKGRAVTQLRRAGLFKGFLFLGAVALTAGLFLMTHQIVNTIRDSSRSHLALSVSYYRNLLLGDNPELAYEAVQDINFPIILSDAEGNPKFWRNIDIDGDPTSPEVIEKVRELQEEFDASGNVPVAIEVFPGQVDYFHYGDPELVSLLRAFTIVSAIAVAVYIFIGYIGFSTIRKAEERSVWVGMARETAHQLGTPISSLLGWLEVLGDEENDIVDKMRQDVARLERIAIRFSKIGAREPLKPVSARELIESSVMYMKSRVGSGISIEVQDDDLGEVPMQPDLIGWVLENLIRNAAQAMGGEGEIQIEAQQDKSHLYIDVTDQGVGIAQRDHEAIFRPGYTTKKRGWGLGLSLARRIMEETHRGRIFVKESRPGEGSTIRMMLPV